MPPSDPSQPSKSLRDVVAEVGLYPEEAFLFVQRGLSFTVDKLHGAMAAEDEPLRHITGQELCEGLRGFALDQYGMLARAVLEHWNIRSTMDFGRIVFALVDAGMMQKTDDDSLDDFRNVYDFRAAFDSAGYRIASS